MNLNKKSIADVESLAGKRVLIRVDFNVPQDKKTGAITNTQRIVGAMPTIEMALAKGAKSVVLSMPSAEFEPPALPPPLLRSPVPAARLILAQCRTLDDRTVCQLRQCR